jgi:hypothetical protein
MCYMMNSSPAIVFRSLYRGGLRVGRVRKGRLRSISPLNRMVRGVRSGDPQLFENHCTRNGVANGFLEYLQRVFRRVAQLAVEVAVLRALAVIIRI